MGNLTREQKDEVVSIVMRVYDRGHASAQKILRAEQVTDEMELGKSILYIQRTQGDAVVLHFLEQATGVKYRQLKSRLRRHADADE
ncbi:hypothetical protein CBS101457_000282 [Exobasidium rhododendri]|nr:hypothetical protein CBS101457_000282 [Exobasidium rhododendri]